MTSVSSKAVLHREARSSRVGCFALALWALGATLVVAGSNFVRIMSNAEGNVAILIGFAFLGLGVLAMFVSDLRGESTAFKVELDHECLRREGWREPLVIPRSRINRLVILETHVFETSARSLDRGFAIYGLYVEGHPPKPDNWLLVHPHLATLAWETSMISGAVLMGSLRFVEEKADELAALTGATVARATHPDAPAGWPKHPLEDQLHNFVERHHRSGDLATLTGALFELGRAGSPDCAPALQAAAQHGRPEVRDAASQALAALTRRAQPRVAVYA